MAENSKIQWTNHTFNPWWGCSHAGPGCDNCYAEAFDRRLGGDHWGPGKPRREFGDKYWNLPLAWDRMAAKLKTRHRVFCASMADVLDNEVPQEWRERLWDLIERTPNLDWLLLTKRIGNFQRMTVDRWPIQIPDNVWVGATMVTQEEFDRDLPKLAKIKSSIRFISMEPLISAIDMSTQPDLLHMIDWVILGGESGAGARELNTSWLHNLIDQALVSGIAVFVKQLGSKALHLGEPYPQKDKKGGDMAEWPLNLHLREYPR